MNLSEQVSIPIDIADQRRTEIRRRAPEVAQEHDQLLRAHQLAQATGLAARLRQQVEQGRIAHELRNLGRETYTAVRGGRAPRQRLWRQVSYGSTPTDRVPHSSFARSGYVQTTGFESVGRAILFAHYPDTALDSSCEFDRYYGVTNDGLLIETGSGVESRLYRDPHSDHVHEVRGIFSFQTLPQEQPTLDALGSDAVTTMLTYAYATGETCQLPLPLPYCTISPHEFAELPAR